MPLNILCCVKRVPMTGGRIVLTADEQAIETRHLGFTISPHEECAVEEAVRLIEANGGSSTVLTLGPDEATDQLREAMAIGIDRAILLQTDGGEWDAVATANAIDRPVVSGAKGLEVRDDGVAVRREAPGGGWEIYDIPRPAVVTVKEGINLPRYPSVPGRLRARKKEIERVELPAGGGAPSTIKLRVPIEQESAVEILGEGPEAAPRVVDVLRRLGLIA